MCLKCRGFIHKKPPTIKLVYDDERVVMSMKRLKYLMLPLFCLSLSLCACNNDTKRIENEVYESIQNKDNLLDVVVDKKTNDNTTIYVVYVYTKYRNMQGGYSYHIDMFIYSNGYLEWIYSI